MTTLLTRDTLGKRITLCGHTIISRNREKIVIVVMFSAIVKVPIADSTARERVSLCGSRFGM